MLKIAHKSTYNAQKWIDERNKNMNYCKNICEFKPKLLRASTKT